MIKFQIYKILWFWNHFSVWKIPEVLTNNPKIKEIFIRSIADKNNRKLSKTVNNTRSQSSIKNTPNLRTNTSSQIQKSSINQSIQNAIKRTNMERLTNIQKPTNSYSIIKNAGKTTINNP